MIFLLYYLLQTTLCFFLAINYWKHEYPEGDHVAFSFFWSTIPVSLVVYIVVLKAEHIEKLPFFIFKKS